MTEKIGIVCASDSELAPFLPHIEQCTTTEHAMLTFYEGTIGQIPVVALYSGVCKVNAAIATQILIDRYQVTAVINAGTAGGMDGAIQLFDTVVTTRAAYHDVGEDILTDFHPWLSSVYFDSSPLLLSIAHKISKKTSHPIRFGKSVTGEQFIDQDRRAEINEAFAPLSVDMETAGIAHVCYVNHVPFVAIRTITDTADHSGVENFERNCETCAEISKEIVLLLLQEWEASL